MIVLNQDRINTKYFYEDNLIVAINSTRKLEELLEILRGGGTLKDLTSVAAVHVYQIEGTEDTYKRLEPREPYTDTPDYNTIFDDDYDGDEDDWVLHDGSRPEIETKSDDLFRSYEQMSFGAKKTKYTFREVNLHDNKAGRQLLMDYLGDAVGIMPHFLTDDSLKETSVSDLKKLSKAADIGYNREIALSFPKKAGKILPNVSDAKLLQGLSNPERALFDNILLPSKAMDLTRIIKEENPRALLTADELYAARSMDLTKSENRITPATNRIRTTLSNGLLGIDISPLVEKADTIFREKFHGHVPRVLREYMLGQLECLNMLYSHIKDSTIEEIVDNFNQQSVACVAATKSPVLLALSDKINFREVPTSHIAVFGTYLRNVCLPSIQANGFIEWYNAHKDINDGDLTTILEQLYIQLTDPTLDEMVFNKDDDVKTTLRRAKNQRGMSDAVEMERKYNYRFDDNDLAIRGRNIVAKQGDTMMYMLPADDYRNFTIGYDTHCCQHYEGAGESCVWKLTSDPYAGAVVIERKGKILAQGFVWTDENKDTLVFDNVEFADDRKVSQFNDLFAVWSQSMPYKNIHVGVGYNQGMQSWGRKITDMVTMPTIISDRHVYSDYHDNARALKKDGDMLIHERAPVQVSETPLVPSRFDTINEAGLGYLLSTGFSMDKMFSIMEKFQNGTLGDDEIFDIIRSSKNDAVIEKFDNLPTQTQIWILNNRPTAVEHVQNPCPELQAAVIANDPKRIKDIPNPSEDLQLAVIHQNGLLLYLIQNPTERVIREAVSANGIAIKLVPPERQTEELKLLAVTNFPRSIISIANPSTEVYEEAIRRDPDIVSILPTLSDDLQVFAVSCNPATITQMKDPCARAITAAVSANGLLIRNFQSQYPFLRERAIRQNPFAIGALSRPTMDECVLALSLNPIVENRITDPALRLAAVERVLSNTTELPQDMTNTDAVPTQEAETTYDFEA